MKKRAFFLVSLPLVIAALAAQAGAFYFILLAIGEAMGHMFSFPTRSPFRPKILTALPVFFFRWVGSSCFGFDQRDCILPLARARMGLANHSYHAIDSLCRNVAGPVCGLSPVRMPGD